MIAREDIACLVLGHGDASATIERHLPLWREAASDVVVFSPWDDPYIASDLAVVCHHHGISSRYGPENNVRLREALRYALTRKAPYVLLCEYDAIVWPGGPLPENARPPVGGIAGARFTEPREWAGIAFRGSQYFHFPILIDRAALPLLVGTLDTFPVAAEGGYVDRTLGFAAELAKLPHVDLRECGLAYTKDTIEPRHVNRLVREIRKGVRFTHGIKDGAILRAVMEGIA